MPPHPGLTPHDIRTIVEFMLRCERSGDLGAPARRSIHSDAAGRRQWPRPGGPSRGLYRRPRPQSAGADVRSVQSASVAALTPAAADVVQQDHVRIDRTPATVLRPAASPSRRCTTPISATSSSTSPASTSITVDDSTAGEMRRARRHQSRSGSAARLGAIIGQATVERRRLHARRGAPATVQPAPPAAPRPSLPRATTGIER